MSSEEIRRPPEKSLALAEKILGHSRRYITQLAPLMLAPVYALRQEPVERADIPLSTDGVHLFYNPERLIRDFQEDRGLPARQLVHVTSHCLLGHLPLRPGEKGRQAVFDSAADMKAAQFAYALSKEFVDKSCRTRPDHFRLLIGTCRQPMGRLLQETEEDARREIVKRARKLKLRLDDHGLWSLPPRAWGLEGRHGALEAGEEGGEAPDWRGMLQDLAERAENSPIWGHLAGMLREEYLPAEENRISYRDFLRRFAAPEERLLLDPDSFDPRWYWLGLEQYGDVPLLEPSELSEPPAPDDIVLALDTSGSCSGETCRRFLRETLSLLRDISAGARRFHVLALQCDTRIQRELLLEEAGQLEHFLGDFAPTGFGGTDFRPVFRRVEALREEGSLPRVRGLLYLSDGFGDFPQEAPDYPVTFLLLDQDFRCRPETPEWVNTLVLDENDFTLKEAQA